MGTYTGRTDNVPKQLKSGMAVVVMFKPEYPLLSWELAAGIIPDKWLKAKILNNPNGNGWVTVELASGHLFSIEVGVNCAAHGHHAAIIIRSTSLADNPTSNERDKIKRNEAKQRRRALAKAAK